MAMIVSKVPVARKPIVTRPLAAIDTVGVPPRLTRAAHGRPSPSRLIPYSVRDAINRQAITALGSETMTTSRTIISPHPPKIALATDAAASGALAIALVGSARRNAMLINR